MIKRSITIEDMDDLRHMLGIDPLKSRKHWAFRNYYCADPQHAGMARLLAIGWVTRLSNRSESPDSFYAATMDGCLAAGLTRNEVIKHDLVVRHFQPAKEHGKESDERPTV
jgi:hypothetical protein